MHTIIKHHFVFESVLSTLYWGISNLTQDLVIERIVNASSIQMNMLYKFGKENLTSLNLKRPSTSTEHTTTGVVPIQTVSTSQHHTSHITHLFYSYVLKKSILIHNHRKVYVAVFFLLLGKRSKVPIIKKNSDKKG